MDKGNNIPKRREHKLTGFRSWFTKTDQVDGMVFNILVKEEDDLFVAHCLELDIVATADAIDEVKNDLFDLIITQVSSAFSNDNLDYLFHPAPADVWKEFYQCKGRPEQKHIQIPLVQKTEPAKFVPPRIKTTTCHLPKAAYA